MSVMTNSVTCACVGGYIPDDTVEQPEKIATTVYEIWENNYHGSTSEVIYSTESYALASFIMRALQILSKDRWSMSSIKETK